MFLPRPSPSANDQPLPEKLIRVSEPDSLDAEAVGRFLRRNGRRCLIWFAASLFAAMAFFALAPSYYTSTATILLEQPQAPAAAGQNGGGDAAARADAFVESQVLVLQSADVLGRVVEKAGLIGRPELGLGTRLRGWIASFLRGSAPIRRPDPRHAAILRMARSLSVVRQGTSDVVEIGFTSGDPFTAATIANAVVTAYIAEREQVRREASEGVTADLRARLAELRQKAFTSDPHLSQANPTSQSEEQARLHFHERQNEDRTYRALDDALLQRLYNEPARDPGPGLRVLTRAEPPLRRSWPPLVLVVAIVVGGSAAGVGQALIKASTDHTLWTVADVHRETGLDRVVGIPTTASRHAELARRNAAPPADLAASPPFVEALGRVVIGLGNEPGSLGGMMIGVVSPTRAAGASSVAVHLAALIAEGGQSTVLVDANWSKPPRAVEDSPRSGRALASRTSALPLGSGDLKILKLRAAGPVSGVSASLSVSATLREMQRDATCIVVDFLALEQAADVEACAGLLQKLVVVAEARVTTSGQLLDIVQRVRPETIAAVVLNKI